MARRLFSTLVCLMAVAGVVTACATPAGSSDTPAPRVDTPAASESESPSPSPSPSPSAYSSDVDAAWLDDGRIIGLVTYGSSTCDPMVTDAVLDAGALTVTLEDPDRDCTLDLRPRVTPVQLPEGGDPTQALEITVAGSYSGQVELAGDETLTGAGSGTQYLPSAGWTGTDGTFAIVSWGSSGCPPVVEDAEATGPAEVTVTFETPAGDTACTADLVPRGTLVNVAGLDSGDGVEAVLSGGEFDDVRIPIVGSN